MGFSFHYNRDKFGKIYPELTVFHTVNSGDVTHERLCEEFYYFLLGCGFHFKDNVIGIGVITKEEPVLPDEE